MAVGYFLLQRAPTATYKGECRGADETTKVPGSAAVLAQDYYTDEDMKEVFYS